NHDRRVHAYCTCFCEAEGQSRLYKAHHSPSSLHSSEGRRGYYAGQNATWIPIALSLSYSFASVSHSLFVPLFRISPRIENRILILREASRLDSRPLPQTRPDGSMAEKTRREVRKAHRQMEAENTRRRRLPRANRSRL